MLRLRDLDTRDGQAGHVSTFFRLRRMNVFRRLVRNLPRPLRILDLGGTFQYWEFLKAADPKEFRVTILNRGSESLDAMDHADFNFRKGDVKDLSWVDRSDFDLIHLNSVIEHLFNAENQQRMASQITSIGLPYWVQTPNYWFPLEPHFHILGWHWLPRRVRIRWLQRRRCGGYGPFLHPNEAMEAVDEIRLLTARDMRGIFPGATIHRERIGPFTKSLVAWRWLEKSG